MALNSVCVFCGASTPNNRRYLDAARELGQTLAEGGVSLVYGGGAPGLMGTVARAALVAGGRVTGIIPTFLIQLEGLIEGLDEFIEVETMHERKKLMFEHSEAFIVLPGGFGTLDETIEILTWAQLGLHAKPILLVNELNYWQPFLALVDHVVQQGFAKPSVRDLFTVVPDVEAVVPTLRALKPASTEQSFDLA